MLGLISIPVHELTVFWLADSITQKQHVHATCRILLYAAYNVCIFTRRHASASFVRQS